MNKKFDALLIVSFGGPEGMDDVIPFLKNVLKGRNVPEERMLAVAKHYEMFGGVSPINQQVRDLISALEELFKDIALELPIYWGNRNWHPMLGDTLKKMQDDGVENALYFVTSAYGSYSGCRQYRENVEEAIGSLGDGAPNLEKLRLYFNHPGFVEANASNLKVAISALKDSSSKDAVVLFTAHSIPLSMAENCEYQTQLEETARLVAESVGTLEYKLVFQSRSGPASQPWLEPDVLDAISELKQTGVNKVVIMPIGFISDHMEVVYDLDTEAKTLAESLGMDFVRGKTVGTHPAFLNTIKDLVLERLEGRDKEHLGNLGTLDNQCNPNCCKPALRPI